MSSPTGTPLLDFAPTTSTFREDVVAGLSEVPRSLPCKYFYDERGSLLFDEICELDEYYLTRTELSIMDRWVAEMTAQIGPGVMLVEYGSGSSLKTRLLLDHLCDPIAYVPVDISREHLQRTADKLAIMYPHIEVLPVCADFTAGFPLPKPTRKATHSAVYFPGSTIGNFGPEAALVILTQIATMCGTGGGLLIGIDLQKDIDVIEAAYNDAKGVTSQFNLNILSRINRELNGDIKVQQFEHEAHYNQEHGRVEIRLVSQCAQEVSIGDKSFTFNKGDAILTEYSHKYTIAGFEELAIKAGLVVRRYWTDPRDRFAVLHLAVSD